MNTILESDYGLKRFWKQLWKLGNLRVKIVRSLKKESLRVKNWEAILKLERLENSRIGKIWKEKESYQNSAHVQMNLGSHG
jgi:hypothetical protein